MFKQYFIKNFVDKMKMTRLYKYVYDFSIDYYSIYKYYIKYILNILNIKYCIKYHTF